MIIVGGACLSLLGIGVRLMESASSLQIVFFRALFQAISLSLLLVWLYRRRPLQPYIEIGRAGLLAAVFFGAAGLFIVLAMRHTTVANAVFIVSLAPLSSALLARAILGEQVSQRTWHAMAIALTGIAIIFGSGLSGGGLAGMGFAFCMMLLYSGALVAIRSQSGADMIAVGALSGLFLALGTLPFIDSFSISQHDLLLCLILGIFQIGLGQVLITKGAAHVPAAQVSLLALLEVVLSPLWVWIGVGEVPSAYSLAGGSIVILGVAYQAMARNRPAGSALSEQQ